MIVALPEMSNTIAVRSYFHENTSSRQHIASTALVIIAVAMFAVRRVMSANGRTPRTIWKIKDEFLLTCVYSRSKGGNQEARQPFAGEKSAVQELLTFRLGLLWVLTELPELLPDIAYLSETSCTKIDAEGNQRCWNSRHKIAINFDFFNYKNNTDLIIKNN